MSVQIGAALCDQGFYFQLPLTHTPCAAPICGFNGMEGEAPM